MKHLISYTKMLIESKSDGLSDLDRELIKAAEKGSKDKITELLKLGANPNAMKPGEKKSAIYLATNSGTFQAMKALLYAGADPNVPDLSGWYPIHACIHTASPKCLELLLQCNADPSKKTEDEAGDTPLFRVMYTSGKASIDRLKILLATDVNPYELNGRGESIFERCALTGNAELMKELVRQVKMPDQYLTNLTYYAAHNSDEKMIDCVLELGAPLDQENQDGVTPLGMLKGKTWKKESIVNLIERGADPIKAGYTDEELVNDTEEWLIRNRGEKEKDRFFAKYLPPGSLKETYRRNTKATNLFGI